MREAVAPIGTVIHLTAEHEGSWLKINHSIDTPADLLVKHFADAKNALDENARLAGLILDLIGISVVNEVQCRGDKCREDNCLSCFDEETVAAAVKRRTNLIREAHQALAKRAEGAHVRRVVGSELSNGEKP